MIIDSKILTGDFGSSLTEITKRTVNNEIFKIYLEIDSLDVSCERTKINVRAQLKQIIYLTYVEDFYKVIV